jgi:hypothetical protein
MSSLYFAAFVMITAGAALGASVPSIHRYFRRRTDAELPVLARGKYSRHFVGIIRGYFVCWRLWMCSLALLAAGFLLFTGAELLLRKRLPF